MSERGSFVTEFIYCPQCFEKMKNVLIRGEKHLDGITFSNHIVAGRIGGFVGEAFIQIEHQLFNKSNAPCHTVRIAILTDSEGSKIFVIHPSGSVTELLSPCLI